MNSIDRRKRIVILMAEDDPDDQHLARLALDRVGMPLELRCVENGKIAIDYLLRSGPYREPSASPRPDLIFLDFMMPEKNGLETLREIKESEELRSIPTVMLTSVGDKQRIDQSYSLGANSFVNKPTTLEEMIWTMEFLCTYWFKLVKLPTARTFNPLYSGDRSKWPFDAPERTQTQDTRTASTPAR